MKIHRLYLLLLFLIIHKWAFAQTEIEPGVLYVKLNNSSTLQSEKTLSLTHIKGLERYTPLKTNTSALRITASIIDGLYKIEVSKETDIRALCDSLKSYGNVLYAEPIYQEQLLYLPNDPAIAAGSQSYLNIIKAFEAWDITRGDSSMIIGISDTGVDYFHPDLVNKMHVNEEDPPNGIDDDGNGYIDDYRGYDFADQDTSALPGSNYHGTRVAGIAGAETDNGFGMAGVGINAKLAALKIFKSESGTAANTYESIIYAADNGYDVINLSWGSANSYTQAAQDIINYAVEEKNLIVIGAAGNTPEDLEFYPASYDNVLSVASTENNDTKASFSSYSYQVDISAPGRAIYGTTSNDGFTSGDGTSFSSPQVAGAAALVKTRFPELNARQIIERIRVTSDNIYDLNSTYQDKLGFGRLNIENALVADEDTLKSIRLESFSVNSDLGTDLYYGDSIEIHLTLKNYLAESTPTVSLSSPSEYIEFNNQSVAITTLPTLSTNTITLTGAKISESAPANTVIPIRVSFEDGYYQDFEYIEIQTASDRIDVTNGTLSFTMSSSGNLGFADDSFFNGIGLTYNFENTISRMSFFVSIDSNQVSDNFYQSITSLSRHEEFVTQKLAKSLLHDGIDTYATSTFSDDSASNPAGLQIAQRTLMNESTNYMIQEYYIGNQGDQDLENISVGLFTDWNLLTATSNKSYYNDSLHAIVNFDLDSTLFVGIKSYYDSLPIHQSIDQNNFGSNAQDFSADWTDSLIYALSKQSIYDTAGWSGGNDIASMIAEDSLSVPMGEAIKSSFIIAFASSLEQLKVALDSGMGAYRRYLQTPLLIETYNSCEGASLTIDPIGGDQFQFFSDPLGQNLITTNDTLITGSVSQDTSFYLRNIDDQSIGDIYRLDVDLVLHVANFDMSTDTLFLDDNNSVSFYDRSFLPVDWLWNFGNNQQATLQNPVVGYNSAGVYNITLEVNNELGCNESFTRELLVAERPDLPEIQDQMICAGASVILSASNTDSLAFFTSEASDVAFFEGQQLIIDNLEQDTIFYVTNTSGPFESLRKAVSIEVIDYKVSFDWIVDLGSTTNSALIYNTSSDYSSTNWMVDGVELSSSDTLSLEVTNSSYAVEMSSISTFGCEASLSQTIEFTTSSIPTLSDQTYCFGEDVVIQPENGTYFGFYEDVELLNLIKKGKELSIDSLVSTQSIYIVGIDQVLPSNAVELVLDPQRPEFTISVTPDTLYLNEGITATFSLDNESIPDRYWSINGSYYDNATDPIILFDSADVYEIVVQGFDTEGCSSQDTLFYTVYNQRPEIEVLSTNENLLKIYPNPLRNNETLTIRGIEEPTSILLIDLSGKTILNKVVFPNKPILLDSAPGVYTLILESESMYYSQKIRIRD